MKVLGIEGGGDPDALPITLKESDKVVSLKAFATASLFLAGGAALRAVSSFVLAEERFVIVELAEGSVNVSFFEFVHEGSVTVPGVIVDACIALNQALATMVAQELVPVGLRD